MAKGDKYTRYTFLPRYGDGRRCKSGVDGAEGGGPEQFGDYYPPIPHVEHPNIPEGETRISGGGVPDYNSFSSDTFSGLHEGNNTSLPTRC